MPLQAEFERILKDYETARHETFGRQHPIWSAFSAIQQQLAEHVGPPPEGLLVKASMGAGNWAKVPWVALMDPRETTTTQAGIYCVYLFREDLSGVYLTLNQGVTEPKRLHGTREGRRLLGKTAAEAREVCRYLERSGFTLDDEINLRAARGLGVDYENSTIAYKLYSRGFVPDDALLLHDLDLLRTAYQDVLVADLDRHYRVAPLPAIAVAEVSGETRITEFDTAREVFPAESNFDLQAGTRRLIRAISDQGYIFEPWQVAQLITAIRTKPFVILAGISGTGKSKLPVLVARATGSASELISVRPDWTDSSEVLGYIDLQGSFRPGRVLELASQATDDDRYWFCVLDEMNLARVELYFAEVLSTIEDRSRSVDGGYVSSRLISQVLSEADGEWGTVALPPNLAVIGTVNMDETTQAFSRKVLDRAFVLELSDVDLKQWRSGVVSDRAIAEIWPVHAWYPRAISLASLLDPTDSEVAAIDRSINALLVVNKFLRPAQLQLGYRSRDEIALFLLHAQEVEESFVSRSGEKVDPLDLALLSKVLPRIIGGHAAIRYAVEGLLLWSVDEQTTGGGGASDIVARWNDQGRPSALTGSVFPRTAARLCLMWDRLEGEGFTSFWL
jgi:hypothetical protein